MTSAVILEATHIPINALAGPQIGSAEIDYGLEVVRIIESIDCR